MERKAFKFYASYYEVYKQLSTPKEKAAFMDALLDRQFTGKEPDNLTGLAQFAYISQRHSIDQQVKGYLDKTGLELDHPIKGGTVGGTVGPKQGGSKGGTKGPYVQEKEKEKEKVQEKEQQKGVVMAFDTKEYLQAWELWVNYRKEIKKPIKGLSAAQGQQNKLSKLGGGDPQKAVEIIMQSIENNWIGLFELKNQTNEQQTNTPDELKAVVNRLVERHNAKNGPGLS